MILRDSLCLCQSEDPFGVVRALRGTPGVAREWCWGHALGRPGWARSPSLQVEGPRDETLCLALAFHEVWQETRQRNDYGWRMGPMINADGACWDESAPLAGVNMAGTRP